MTDDPRTEKNFEGSSLDLTEALFWHLLQRTEENHKKNSFRLVPDKIRTEHLPNTDLQHYQ
jgi:hypothetical protein